MQWLGALALASGLTACTGDDGATMSTTTAPTGTATEPTTEPTGSGSTGGTTATTGTTAATTGTTEGTTAGTTAGAEAECVVDSDCQKIANCCECSSIPADEEAAECENDCLVDTCTAEGLETIEAACRSGVCEFGSTIACSGPVSCDSLPPECEGDEVPSIVDECWGPCVPYHYCVDTSACTPSCGEAWVCVESQSGGAGGCMPLAGECEGTASCECVAPYWDEVCESACSGDSSALLCNDGG